MSLLDDVSIVVTPNGYKAGELYAVVPVPTEGSEEVTDGNFPSPNTSWSLSGWEILGNLAKNSVDGAGNNLYQGSVTSVNQLFKVVITATITAGSVKVMLGGGTGGYNEIGEATSTGTFTYYGTSFGTDNRILLQTGTGSVIGSVQLSNISVKEYTSADMDVTRETAATRVDEDGLVNYAEVLGSEEVTDGNFPSPNTAWDLSPTFTIADNKLHCVSDGSYQYANQSAMVVGKTYRITFDITGWVSGNVRVRPSGQSPFQLAGSNGSYIFYYTAVSNSVLTIERNGTPTDLYIENISVKEATIDNLPRVDYTDGTSSLLVEPQRTNLLTYSEDFTNWNAGEAVVVSNQLTSPSGEITADKLNALNPTNQQYISLSPTVSSGSVYTLSCFAKKGEVNYIALIGLNPFTTSFFDLNNGTLLGSNATSSSIEDYGNGWYRCTSTFDADTTSKFSGIYLSYNGTTISNGTNISNGEGVYIYGAQLEQGSYPTSYIKTSGSTVTRNQETYEKTGISDLINSEEGVLFVELSALANDGLSKRITLADGSISNRVSLELDETANKIKAFITLNGSSEVLEYTATNLLQFNKIAIKWKANDFAIWFNGSAVVTETAESRVPTGLTELVFEGGNSLSPFYGKVRQLQVFKTADIDLAALTS